MFLQTKTRPQTVETETRKISKPRPHPEAPSLPNMQWWNQYSL